MKTIALTFVLFAPIANLLAGSTDSVQTAEGVLKITPVTHGSLMLEFKGKVIHVDPWSRGDYTGLPKADLILITDIHGDHMDPVQVKQLKKSGTLIVAPQAVAQTVTEAVVLHNGQSPASSSTIGEEATATCCLGGKRVYISGDNSGDEGL